MLQGTRSVRIFVSDERSFTTLHRDPLQPPMDHASHMLDIEMLRHDRNQFILECQRTIAIVVKYHTQRGMFSGSEFDDIIQSVNEELIQRLDSIERNFNGSVMLNTYMNVVIRNICLTIFERTRRNPVTEPITEMRTGHDSEAMAPVLLQDEYRRFSHTMRLSAGKRSKMIFCFKVYFRLPVTEQDVQRAFDRLPEDQWRPVLERFGTEYDDTLEADNFNSIASLMNLQEKNTTTGASLLRWTHDNLTRTITMMNGDPPVRSHTKETVKLLLEEVTP